ncbi:hypothetical protein H5410_040957 [Solanum commersonii]|uniref:Uncharacterized protein n=1 Tax=Solanum commersonii TaxID=4109 RepID=A0A9J5XQ91_SOLCO|nr:hypothetical protein H5410_040957 [Solanum commersonii]
MTTNSQSGILIPSHLERIWYNIVMMYNLLMILFAEVVLTYGIKSMSLTKLLLTSPTKHAKVFLKKQSSFYFIFTLKWFQKLIYGRNISTHQRLMLMTLNCFSSPWRQVYALRALTPYGEPLVFTSKELPLPHWN